jgi:uncharacterized membrane protein
VHVQTTATETKETGRLEAFSDGVFAIAITLLVLELKAPELEEGATSAALLVALLRQWPSYFAYLVSFATILIMWVSHHGLFNLIARSNGRFLFINGVLLLLITTVPFPTSLLARYLTQPAAPTACAVYCGLFVLLALAFNGLWRYAAAGGRLLHHTATPQRVAAITRGYLAGPLVYGVALLLAFVNVYASLGVCAALAVFFALLGFER